MFGIVRALGFLFSIAWIGLCALYVQSAVGFANLGQMTLGETGLALIGVFLPLVLIWSLAVARLREQHSRMLLAQKIDALQKVQILPDTLDNHIAAITETFRGQARQFQATAEETLGTFANMSSAYEEQSRNVIALSASIQEQRTLMEQMFDEQNISLHGSQRKTEALFAVIEKSTEAAQRVGREITLVVDKDLNRANATLTETAENVKGLAGEIWDQLKNLETAYSSSQQMAEGAQAALQRQAHEIGHVTSQAVNEVDRFADKLEPRISQIEDMGAHAAEMTANIEQQMMTQRDVMESVGEALASKSNELQLSVKEQSESLSNLLDNFDQRSTSLTEGFEQKVSDVLTIADRAGEAFNEKIASAGAGLEARTDDLNSSVTERLDEMASKARTFEQQLQTQVDSLVGLLDRRIDEASTTIDKFETTLVAAGDKASSNVSQMVTRFAEELDEAGQNAMQSVLTTAQELPEMAKTIGDSAESAATRIQNAGGDIVSQSQHLARSAADLMSYGDQIRNDLQRLPNDLRSSIESLDSQVKTIAEEIQGTYGQVSNQVVTTNEEFERNKNRIEQKLAEFSGFYKELQTFGHQIEAHINDQTRLVDTATAKAKLAWQEAQKAMRLHADETVEFSDSYISNVTKAAETARREVDDLHKISTTTVNSVYSSSEAVGNQLKDFTQSLVQLKDMIQTVGNTAHQQRQDLNASGVEVEQKAQARTEELLAEKRDVFLKSAGSMVAQLQRAAVDVDKVMSGDLAPEVVEAFRSGDKSVSIRRLLERNTPAEAGQIEKLYHGDAAFHEAVNTYMKLFASLLDQAKESDPSKLLHTTFLTGDIGKLYIFLSQSLQLKEAA